MKFRAQLANLCRNTKLYSRLSICILIVFLEVFIAYSVKQLIPRSLLKEYDFGSGISFNETTFASSLPIFFPDVIRHEGSFKLTNNTGCDICVATNKSGFSIMKQGTYVLTEKPLGFFVLQPNFSSEFEGTFSIEECDKIQVIYSLKGNRSYIQNIDYSLNIL